MFLLSFFLYAWCWDKILLWQRYYFYEFNMKRIDDFIDLMHWFKFILMFKIFVVLKRRDKLRCIKSWFVWLWFKSNLCNRCYQTIESQNFDFLCKSDSRQPKLTYYIKKCEKLTKEISISPPIMIFEIIIQVIKKQFLLLFLFYFRYYTHV